jgi:hypothetical protein
MPDIRLREIIRRINILYNYRTSKYAGGSEMPDIQGFSRD